MLKNRAFLLWLRYDGTEFHGWQRQANARSVQGALEGALAVVLKGKGSSFRLGTTSRTDAGVHALRHPVGLETDSRIPMDGLLKGLNSVLPRDVSVVEVARAPEGFSARKASMAKTYVYRVMEDRVPDPFEDRYSWRLKGRLDLDAVRAGARHLLGEHDFSAFRSAECDAGTPRRLLNALVVQRDGRVVTFTVCGNAFLRNMVRIIVGSLVEVGMGRHAPEWIASVLASRDRTQAGRTAPPRGLFLAGVEFPTELLAEGAHAW